LQHHTDSAHERGVVAPRVAVEHADPARTRRAVALERLDGGRLARAVRAEQRHDLALVGGE
jgi:hypothetical protein